MQTRTERIKFWLNDKDLKQIERKGYDKSITQSCSKILLYGFSFDSRKEHAISVKTTKTNK